MRALLILLLIFATQLAVAADAVYWDGGAKPAGVAVDGTSNDDLCIATITGASNKTEIEAELTRRNAICDWQKIGLMLQVQQNREQAANAKIQQAQAEAIAEQQRRQHAANTFLLYQQTLNQQRLKKTNCTTSYFGGQAHTNCTQY